MPKTDATPTTGFTLVAATAVPTRAPSATAKAKLAEFQAAEKIKREALAAPAVAGLVDGQALTDGTTYETAAAATLAAGKAKRLVEPGLLTHNLRPAIRVTGEAPAFTWFLITVAKAPAAEAAPAAETPTT